MLSVSSFGSAMALLKMKTSAVPPLPSSIKLRQQRRSAHTSKTIRTTKSREWAGAESMFSTASTMRQSNLLRIKGAWESRPKPWKNRIRRRRRRRRRRGRGGSEEIDISEFDLWGVEKAVKGLSLPPWACVDSEEQRRLGAMNIILEKDLEMLESKTIIMPDNGGRVRKVVDVFPDVYSDVRRLRFLRKDKIQDPVTAALRYRDFLQWRNDNAIDEIRALVESNPFEPPTKLSRVGDLLPGIFRAEPVQEENGIVPVLLQVGAWDSTTITKLMKNNELTLTSFLQYWVYIFESIHKHLYNQSMKTKQMVYIDEVCDLTGMNMSQFSPGFISTVLKPWIHLTQSYYPETAKFIRMLNPPNILFVVWKLVTPMVSPGTVAKIRLNSRFKGTGQQYYHTKYDVKEDSIKASV